MNLTPGERLVFLIKGTSLEGDDVSKTVAVQLRAKGTTGNPAADARQRLAETGLTVTGLGEQLQVSSVKFGSRAAKARVEQGYDIVGVKVRNDRISAHWFYVPGVAIALLVWIMQGWRMRRPAQQPAPKPA